MLLKGIQEYLEKLAFVLQLQAPVQQEAGVRVEAATVVIELVGHRADVLLRTDGHAGDDIRVAIEIFSRTVQLDIKAQRERAKIAGRGKGIID